MLARERGDRRHERMLLSQSLPPLVELGPWDEAMPIAEALISRELDLLEIAAATCGARIAGARGDEHMWTGAVRSPTASGISRTAMRASVMVLRARDALERGAPGDALALARPVLDLPSIAGEMLAEGFAILVEAALSLAHETAIDELAAFSAALPPARATPLLRAGRARVAAEQAHRRGDPAGSERYETTAIELLRTIGARPLLAQALLERSRWRADPNALAEARTIYTELGAIGRLARIEHSAGVMA